MEADCPSKHKLANLQALSHPCNPAWASPRRASCFRLDRLLWNHDSAVPTSADSTATPHLRSLGYKAFSAFLNDHSLALSNGWTKGNETLSSDSHFPQCQFNYLAFQVWVLTHTWALRFQKKAFLLCPLEKTTGSGVVVGWSMIQHTFTAWNYEVVVVQLLSCVWLFVTHGLQHTRPPCPSPTPRVYPNSCPLSQWCYPTISSSVALFSSCP